VNKSDRHLGQFFKGAGNDMYTLLADMTILSDGVPSDPAAWSEWLHRVESVVDSGGQRDSPR
jgi:hypothetical protein